MSSDPVTGALGVGGGLQHAVSKLAECVQQHAHECVRATCTCVRAPRSRTLCVGRHPDVQRVAVSPQVNVAHGAPHGLSALRPTVPLMARDPKPNWKTGGGRSWRPAPRPLTPSSSPLSQARPHRGGLVWRHHANIYASRDPRRSPARAKPLLVRGRSPTLATPKRHHAATIPA